MNPCTPTMCWAVIWDLISKWDPTSQTSTKNKYKKCYMKQSKNRYQYNESSGWTKGPTKHCETLWWNGVSNSVSNKCKLWKE